MTLADVSLAEWAAADHETRRAAVRLWRETIARRDAEIHAWAIVADELEAPAIEGPLRGLPIAFKDIFDVAGLPAEFGSPLYRGRVADRDCALAAHLKRRGAVVLGKTHTTAFAYFDPGPTRNPRRLEHTPGGSSSGSAAAVAAGMAPVAVGSQTMGSVLRPASFCGVVGFKPTFGRLPMEGVLPFAPSFDHPGYFTRTVADLVFFWEAAHDEAPSERAPRDVAVLPWPIEGEVEAPMREAFEGTLEDLARSGFKLHRTPLPESFRALPGAIATVLAREAAETHRERFREHGAAIGAKLARLVEEGSRTSETSYARARQAIRRAGDDYAVLLERCPLTATPAALGPAPRGLDSTGDPRANAPWTALGAPATALPMRVPAGELPLGLQLSAGRGRERDLLAAALAAERAGG